MRLRCKSAYECLASLADNLAFNDALTILDDVPKELRDHEAMAGVVAKVVEVLADMLNCFTFSDPPTAAEQDLKRQVANALAKALGSVDGFFNDSSCLKYRDNSFYTCLPLKFHILALSTQAMEALLASETLEVATEKKTLEVATENEVYTLLGCWVHQSPLGAASDGPDAVTVAKRLPFFRRRIKFVRLQHLSLEYIANVVTPCPLVNQSGLLLFILRSSLVTRDADPEQLTKEGVHSAPRNRGHGNLVWDCESTFYVADHLTLDKEEYLYKCMGLVDGYPLRFTVAHESRDGKEPSLGMYVFVIMPPWTTHIWEGGVGRCTSLAYTLRVTNREREEYLRLRYGEKGLGFSDVFGKSWDNMFHETSSYFPDGQLAVEVTMEVVEKGGRAVETCE